MLKFERRLKRILMESRAAVALDLGYRVRPPEPPESIPAGVMLLLGLSNEDSQGASVLITRRTNRVQTHKGQYAFPGGMMDPEDQHEGQGIVTTALRELQEEMGIDRDRIQTVGTLPRLWTPTGFLITPVVGVLREPLEKVDLIPNPEEIDLHFWARLDELLAPGVHRVESHRHGNVEVPVEVFLLGEHRIWGATGAMLKNFLDRLGQLG